MIHINLFISLKEILHDDEREVIGDDLIGYLEEASHRFYRSICPDFFSKKKLLNGETLHLYSSNVNDEKVTEFVQELHNNFGNTVDISVSVYNDEETSLYRIEQKDNALIKRNAIIKYTEGERIS